jgi:hypothetical protein
MINEYYASIVKALSLVSRATIPAIPAMSLRPFWTEELDDLKAKSVFWHRVWQDAGRPSNGALHQVKVSCQLKYKLAIRQAFVNFEHRHTDDLNRHFLNKNIPEFWKVWNKKFSKSVASQVTLNGSNNDQDIADAFAVHFVDVFSASPVHVYNSRDNAPDNTSEGQYISAADGISIVSYEVLDRCIRNLKCGKAAGPDGLTAEHLLYAHPLLIMHLCLLFRTMISHSFVPDDFGLGIIVPLIKDKCGSFNNVDNYRGITLTPIISKLLEGVLLECCEEQLTVDDLQYGFRKKVGCADAMFTLRYVVDHFTSRGSMVYAAALDISKAFDTVNHQQLIIKMSQAGIPHWVTSLISSWYSKLYVAVRWNGCLSNYFKVNSGVRQGSILSPALFNLYINQLIVNLRICSSGCHVNNWFIGCIFYADDILLLSASVTGLQRMLNVCTDSVSDLSLKFNCAKSMCIAFGCNKDVSIPEMRLSGNTICWSGSIKYLGLSLLAGRSVVMDDALVKRKFYASCNAILCNSVGQPELMRLSLLESYCLPILTYCTMAMNIPQKIILSFNVCWNMLYRRVFNFNKWESVSLFIAGLGRLNFTHMFQWLQFKMLKKFIISSTDTVKHLMNSYVMDSDLLERCHQYNVNLDMSFNDVKMAITESFWSVVGFFDC